MKTLFSMAVLIVVMLLVFIGLARAASLTCDTQEKVTHYLVTVGGNEVYYKANADTSMNIPISGPMKGTVQACSEYVLDGTPQGVYECSEEKTPFDLSGGEKSLTPPQGMRLSK